MSVYDGRLVNTDTELFFIAERFNGWEIMESCKLSDIQRVRRNESFMGIVVEIHTSGSHWSLKENGDHVDVEHWIKGQVSTVNILNSDKAVIEQNDQALPKSVSDTAEDIQQIPNRNRT